MLYIFRKVPLGVQPPKVEIVPGLICIVVPIGVTTAKISVTIQKNKYKAYLRILAFPFLDI